MREGGSASQAEAEARQGGRKEGEGVCVGGGGGVLTRAARAAYCEHCGVLLSSANTAKYCGYSGVLGGTVSTVSTVEYCENFKYCDVVQFTVR